MPHFKVVLVDFLIKLWDDIAFTAPASFMNTANRFLVPCLTSKFVFPSEKKRKFIYFLKSICVREA